ncbi:MAG: hypothetical protein H3C32_02730 [Anaerolineae bacterium]|nr:MAG: hypothetical protein UZ13_01589 [Chloroflexi bacterium OLB13]MBW7878204.1 hypothetical protein [Anaerolineae bacterium]
MFKQTDPLAKDESQLRRGRAWLGITGLILTIVFAAVAYILSAPLAENTQQFVGQVDPSLWRTIVGVALFFICMMVMSVLFAMMVPKTKEKFSDREMKRDKREIQVTAAAKKARQQQVRKQIAKARREGK